MQKIEINRDLFTMIDFAKTGFSLKENAKFPNKIVIPATALTVGLCATVFSNSTTLDDYFAILSNAALLYLGHFGLYTLENYLLKDNNREKANLELLDLATKLSALDINTTAELLMNAKLIKKKYRIVNKDKKVSLVENKHIEIKVQNGCSKEFEEILLQEHTIGSDCYEISVEEPKKVLQYKLFKSTI